jgi:hypothetical protein
LNTEETAVKGEIVCLEAVLITLMRLAKILAPLRLLKHPETFCLVFTMRKSRSDKLLSNGTEKSTANKR